MSHHSDQVVVVTFRVVSEVLFTFFEESVYNVDSPRIFTLSRSRQNILFNERLKRDSEGGKSETNLWQQSEVGFLSSSSIQKKNIYKTGGLLCAVQLNEWTDSSKGHCSYAHIYLAWPWVIGQENSRPVGGSIKPHGIDYIKLF